MNIIKSFKNNKIIGIDEKSPQHIETVMSHVFLYKNTVYKIFKHEKSPFFGDLTDRSFRKEFFEQDFGWNHTFSPEIYTALRGLNCHEGTWSVSEKHDDAEDFCIEMVRVDNNDNLINRLIGGSVSESDVVTIIKNQTSKLDLLTKNHKDNFEHLYNRGWHDLLGERMSDLKEWAYMADKEVLREKTDERMSVLMNFIDSQNYFKAVKDQDMTVTIDNHAGNVVFMSDTPKFIDIYLPKDEWRVVDHNNNIGRIAACVRTLGSNKLADAMYDEYSKYKKIANKEINDFYECYNAYIKAYYYIHINRLDLSSRYFEFADTKLLTL